MNFPKKNYILRKKLNTFLFLCFTITLFSQNPPTAATFKQQDIQYWQDALQLIQPQITTGILYNKVSPFCNLYTFNTAEYNTANSKLFKQALSELHRASDNQSQFISIGDLKDFKEQVYFSNNNPAIPIVEIGVINTSFNFLFYNEENEDDGGLKYINGVYTPIVGKTTVFEKHVSLISPQKEFIIASTDGTVSFRINNTIYFNNGKSIKTLTTNFGSNGSFSLVTNEVVNTNLHNVTYASFGEKIIEFNITYTDNSTLTTFAKIRVINREASQNIPPPNGCSKTNIIPYTSTEPPYQAWDEQSAINGKLEYKIFFGDNNLSGNCDLSRVKKPFILIDGFDPGDKRRIELSDCNPFCQTLNKNVEGVFEPNEYKSLYSLMTYNNGDNSIVGELQEENYDVIIINLPTERAPWDENEILHDFGADYIQRNAMTLTSFIKEVNTSLADNNSTEELVIVGPSMGGQITRYALAYMEKQEQVTGNNSWYHNTRLWVSMDSPHQGANIPLAIQGSIYFLGFINGDDEAKK
ncbi:MAG: hypothetical protein L3J09_06435 [Flavobacteriaceae bacterium]|nr:hypothetical protein [Flavobacteriaceae bacterium]